MSHVPARSSIVPVHSPATRRGYLPHLVWLTLSLGCANGEGEWRSSGLQLHDGGDLDVAVVSSDGGLGATSRVDSDASTVPFDEDTLAPPLCPGGCMSFPSEPLVERSEPAIRDDEIARFADPEEFTAPSFCLMEPQLSQGGTPGALFPKNWLRPRFRWEGGSDGALYEVRLHSAFERHDLRAYTRSREWTLPEDVWKKASRLLRKVTVTVRALTPAGELAGIRGTFHIAPVETTGNLLFWAATSAEVGPTTSKLHGFSVGDESVAEVLRAAEVETVPVLHENGRDLRGEYDSKPGFEPGQVRCIGCHTATPDGNAVVFTDDYPWSKVVASLEPENVGAAPAYVSPGAQTLLKQPWLGVQTMSPAHWQPGDRILVASYGTRSEPFGPYVGGRDRLAWFDLEAAVTIPSEVPENGAAGPSRDDVRAQRNAAISAAQGSAWGLLATDGEERNAVTPSFSHDGTRVVYVSTDRAPNGHPAYDANVADLKVVQYNGRAGGAAEALAGAASADWLEYHPSFSPDDAYITFTRAPGRGPSPHGPYYNPNGEIYVVRADGAEAPVRLAANDPVACSGEHSPGVLNSWSKWSPAVRADAGKNYYFLIFSSARRAPDSFDIPRSEYTPGSLDTRSSALYLVGFVVDETGKVTSYPAVYLWNQNRISKDGTVEIAPSSNLTPSWSEDAQPPVIVE